jgi:hypothetical protein
VVRRELTGVPKIVVVGLSKEKVRRSSGTRLPRPAPTWPESRGNDLRYLVRQTEQNGHSDSTLPPACVMMSAWIWNGSATTS